MHWRIKAFLQNQVSRLPDTISYLTYHLLMKYFRGYDAYIDPRYYFNLSIKILESFFKHSKFINSDQLRILEIGTGRPFGLPIGLWLQGCENIITTDLNCYLRNEVVMQSISYIRENYKKILDLFWRTKLHFNCIEVRLRKLISVKSIEDFNDFINIRYDAPADARNLSYESSSFDIICSSSLFEHVPPEIISAILEEMKRLLSPRGVMIHFINTADHFGPSPYEPCADDTITTVNFLQFSDTDWEKIARNKFNYHNRLRAHDYLELFNQKGFTVLDSEQTLDNIAYEFLKNNRNFNIDSRFKKYSIEQLAMSDLYYMGTCKYTHHDEKSQ